MRLTKLFTRTSKTAPADEVAKNANLLIRAGYIYKEMAGVYAYLPLGLRVLEKLKTIIREEMDSVDGQELIMTALQSKELWQSTDRWDDDKVDIWFKSKLKNDTEVGFGWSHEEPITQMMKSFISSYRDLPFNVYQFQTKLRNELRAKSGILRGREFVMKDMYSYARTDEELQKAYDDITKAYLRVFDRVGLGDTTFFTFASGGAFTQFSHEFQTLSEAGEDTIYLHRAKKIAINEEVMTDEVLSQLEINRDELEKMKATEVGNIFNFGTVKSKQLGLYFKDDNGDDKLVYLGSYGIGITRLMGVIAENFSDDKGLVWPEAIAPAKVYIVSIGGEEAVKKADSIYRKLMDNGIEVIYDDRDERPGTKFADSELLGIPYRVTISDRLDEDKYEFTVRKSGETNILTLDELLAKLS